MVLLICQMGPSCRVGDCELFSEVTRRMTAIRNFQLSGGACVWLMCFSPDEIFGWAFPWLYHRCLPAVVLRLCSACSSLGYGSRALAWMWLGSGVEVAADCSGSWEERSWPVFCWTFLLGEWKLHPLEDPKLMQSSNHLQSFHVIKHIELRGFNRFWALWFCMSFCLNPTHCWPAVKELFD